MTQPSNRRLITQAALSASTLRRLGRVGSRLVDGTRPVRAPGCNIYDLGLSDTVTASGAYLSDNDIRARLDAAVGMGARLVRTHAAISAGHPLSIFPTQTSLRTAAPQEAAFLKLDRIVYEAGLRNLWLMMPLQDQHAPDYYHGNVVTFCNMSLGTGTVPATTATIATYYSDATTLADTKAYNAAIYNRVNTLTGVTYANDPAVAIFETVNEGYSATAVWTQAILDHGRSIATATLFADGSNACDGRYPDGTDSTGTLAGYNSLTLARPADVMGSHLYDSNRMSLAWLNKAARMTTAAGYVHLLAEWGWTNVAQGLASPAETFATTIQRVDFVTGFEGNSDVQGSLFWSLFAGSGAPPSGTHGDRFELCFPPTNAEQAAGADELSSHASRLLARPGRPPTVASVGTVNTAFGDTFPTAGAVNATKWTVVLAGTGAAVSVVTAGYATYNTGTAGSYGGVAVLASKAAARADRMVAYDYTPDTQGVVESYFRCYLRGLNTPATIDGGDGYVLEVGSGTTINIKKRVAGADTVLLASTTIAGAAAGVVMHVEFGVVGSTITARAWTGATRPTTPTFTGTDTAITLVGSTSLALNDGSAVTAVTGRLTNFVVTDY